jgi:hypothetical protein
LVTAGSIQKQQKTAAKADLCYDGGLCQKQLLAGGVALAAGALGP